MEMQEQRKSRVLRRDRRCTLLCGRRYMLMKLRRGWIIMSWSDG